MTLYPNNNKEVNKNYIPPASTRKRELIDRGQINYTWWELPGGKFSDGVTLQSVIHAMPTVDAIEAVYGEWVPECKNRKRCSNCGLGRNTDTQIGWNFCPNCGANMNGKDNVQREED